MSTVKDEAKNLIDRLPDGATWDDILYEIHVRKKIDAGLKDLEEGRIVSHEEIARRGGGDERIDGRIPPVQTS